MPPAMPISPVITHDFLVEALRYQLEHRAIAGTETEHGDHEQAEGGHRAGQVETDRGDPQIGGQGVHHQQAADAADAIGEGATERRIRLPAKTQAAV